MNARYLLVSGRVLLSVIFLLSGLGKIIDWDGNAQAMASQGMPLIPLLLIGAIITELAGGLSVLLGWKARWGALLLFLYLIPTTLIFHNFWAFTGAEMQTQLVNFLKNLSIMGGLLLVAAHDGAALVAEREADVTVESIEPRLHRAMTG
ncbi:MAG TPA: DoxX family protein [Candidatus Binatia bacterium]|jgi:putative oxidoreductase